MKQIAIEKSRLGGKAKNEETPLVSIVDDDTAVRVSTLRLLRWSGLKAEAFISAEEFLASKFLSDTACLLLDVRMSGMSGLELQRRLTENGRRIPVVFLSGGASEEEEKRALQAGAISFLRKPVPKEGLFRALIFALGGTPNNPLKEL